MNAYSVCHCFREDNPHAVSLRKTKFNLNRSRHFRGKLPLYFGRGISHGPHILGAKIDHSPMTEKKNAQIPNVNKFHSTVQLREAHTNTWYSENQFVPLSEGGGDL
jgi:hypothetical protein